MQKISIIAFNKNIFCWTELLCILAKSDEKKQQNSVIYTALLRFVVLNQHLCLQN
jgi:hypothetical protein